MKVGGPRSSHGEGPHIFSSRLLFLLPICPSVPRMHGRDGQRWKLGGAAARRLLHRLLPFLPGRSPTPEDRLLRAICQGRLQRAERWASHPQLAVGRTLPMEPHWVPEHCSPTGESSFLCFHCPITPLAAAVSLVAPEAAGLRLVRLLAARGGAACLDECWRDHTGGFARCNGLLVQALCEASTLLGQHSRRPQRGHPTASYRYYSYKPLLCP